jgi:hypothetical protein
MKLTVSDCLKLGSFDDANVLAGETNLGNTVKTVSVLEASSREEAARFCTDNNQLTFTSFSNIRDNELEQCGIIEELAAGGNAGLVIFHEGEIVQKVGNKVISTAERFDFPLIVMDRARAPKISEAITEVTSKLFYGSGEEAENRLIGNTVIHLLNFDKYAGFQEAVRGAAVNNDFQVVLLSEEFNPVFVVETQYNTTIEEAVMHGRDKAEISDSAIGTLIDVEGTLTYWWPMMLNDTKYFMLVVDNKDQYSSAEMIKLAEIIELAMGMWKFTPVRDAKTEFINALRRRNIKQAFALKDEAGVDPADIISVFMARGVEKDVERHIMQEFSRYKDLSIIRIIEDNNTYGMILRGKEEEKGDSGKSECLELFNRLKEQRTIRIFHVTGLKGLEGAYNGYRLISEAQGFTEAVFPYKRVFTKYDLALVSNCIFIQLRGGYIKKDFTDLLDGFRDIGENKGRQLLDTLETFVLDAGMNSAKTSEFMGIHANTVQYRLKRINDVLGAEISGNRVLPGLTVALALSRLERQADK